MAGVEKYDLTKEEYWESYTLDMTIDMIFNILKDVESAEEHGLDETELDYYTSVLAYQPNETKISQERSEENDNGKYTETVSRLQKAW